MEGWISVADRLPEAGLIVDVWRAGTGRFADAYVYSVDEAGRAFWQRDSGAYIGKASVTHWRPRPDPPPGETWWRVRANVTRKDEPAPGR